MNREEYKNGGAYIVARSGEQCATKLTEAQALEILQRCELRRHYTAQARALSNTALAEKYGISGKAVGRIINNRRGASGKPYRGITAEDRDLIRQCAAERDRLKSMAAEHSLSRIAAEYGVSAALVDKIGMGQRWVRLPLQLKPEER